MIDAALPATGEGRRLHPASLVTGILHTIRQSILGLLPLAGSFAFSDRPFVSVPVAIAILAGIVLFPTLGWLRFRYTIGADALVIEQGVVGRKRRVIPYERVQDIDVERGLIARATGTALVKVETGGAGKDEGALDVITLDEVERLRAAIRGWRGAAAPSATPHAAAAPVAAEPAERLLYRMPFARVVLSGILGFSLVYIALIFGAFQYVEPLIDGTRFDLQDRIGDAVDAWQDGRGVDAGAAARLATVYAVGLLLGAALALGFLTGVVLALLRDHGFRLTATAAGFRVRRGLLTLKEVQLPRARVQRASMKAALLMRPFGLWRLELGTLGSAAEKGGSHAVAPLARVEEITPILTEIGLSPAPPPGMWRRGEGLLVLLRALPPSGIVLAIFAGLSIAFPPFLPMLVLLLPFAALAWFAWRGERHAVADAALHVRTGIVARRHVVVPLRRIQSVTLGAGPLERMLGLAHVAVDVAGASGAGPTTVAGLRPEDARALATTLLAGRRAPG